MSDHAQIWAHSHHEAVINDPRGRIRDEGHGVEAIDESVEPAPVVVPVSGEIDASDDSWADQLAVAMDSGADRIVVDLLNVTFIDSSFVRELILAHQRVAGTGWLRVVYTHHLIGRVIEICGLAETFPQFTTIEAALRDSPTRAAALRHAEPDGPPVLHSVERSADTRRGDDHRD